MAALAVALLLCLVLSGPALGADPSPLAANPSPLLIDPLDPRAGDGAGGMGSPLLAAVAVLGLGALAAGATVAYLRLTRPR